MNRFPLRGHGRLLVLGILFVLAVAVTACNPLGEDWKRMPTGIGYEHHGSTIQVEPGEEFLVGLRANAMFPEVPWRIAAIDAATIELTAEGHDTEVRAPGDWRGGEGSPKPWAFIPTTRFDFVGRAEGVSQLRFDIQADGETHDVYELTVAVMDDACDVDEDATGIIAPIRCEDEEPDRHEVVLAYDNYGWAVQLEPGAEFTVELRANGLHPSISWQIAEIDTAVVDLQWLVHDTDVQSLVEHSRWPRTTFPETRLSFIGRALGESLLVLENRAGDGRLDMYELLVRVVEDACAVDPGMIIEVC